MNGHTEKKSGAKVAPFSKTAPGWSRFGSTFFLSAACRNNRIVEVDWDDGTQAQ